MPTYRLVIAGTRTGAAGYTTPEATRTFVRYVKAPTRAEARSALTSPVQDIADGASFDVFTVRSARKTSVYEVITTDNTAWHSNGITGCTTFYDKGKARTHLRRTLAGCAAGQGAFLRDATNDK